MAVVLKGVCELDEGKVQVAFVAAEFGVERPHSPDYKKIPIYSGGMGGLDGDFLKTAADLGLPVVGLGILYDYGYLKQRIENGWQHEDPVYWNPEEAGLKRLSQVVEININERTVKVGAWQYDVKGKRGQVPLPLLTTNIEGNTPWDRGLTARLYDSGGNDAEYYRLCQEVVLGEGGFKMLKALGYAESTETYSLNDCHGALLPYALSRESGLEAAIDRTWFTTHTPVEAGFDMIPEDKVKRVLGAEAWEDLRQYGEFYGRLSMAHLATRLARGVNAVSRKHADVSNTMDIFSGRNVFGITNGVHPETWTSPHIGRVYDNHVGDWRLHPELLAYNADAIPFAEFQEAKRAAVKELCDYVKENYGHELDPNIPILGSARRFAGYKRGNILFSDVDRLAAIAKDQAQIIIAGKAHPADHQGKEILNDIYHKAQRLMQNGVPTYFLENYDMKLAALLTAACTWWLNTPERGREASGTSGMKVNFNGGKNISTLDGWWAEAYNGQNGVAIAPDNTANLWEVDRDAIYWLLEHEVLPLQRNPQALEAMTKEGIKLAGHYNSFRMLGEYVRRPWNKNGLAALLEAA